jgi:nucleotide-binding universal stress UspA family protein
MKTILLPTDFSEASEKALEFAIHIAKKSESKIIVASAYFIPVLENTPPSMLESLYEDEKAEVESELIKICQRITSQKTGNGKNIQCEFIAEHSLPITEITKLALHKKADLIIMGTNGADDLLGLFGSTTVGILNKVYCPVLVVHENTTLQDFKNIYFAIENMEEDSKTTLQLIDFARTFDSNITILHANAFSTKFEEYEKTLKKNREYTQHIGVLKDYLKYDRVHYEDVFTENTPDGIINYLKVRKANILVLLKYERGWIDSLFHKSVIKAMIKKSTLPLLIIHKDDN